MTTHDIVVFLEDLAQRVKNEEADALEALASVRWITKSAQAAEVIIEPVAQDQAANQPKTFFHAGINWTKKEGAKRYNYDKVPEVRNVKDMLEVAQVRAKMAADRIERGIDITMVDGKLVLEDGEMVTPAKIEFTKSSLSMGK